MTLQEDHLRFLQQDMGQIIISNPKQCAIRWDSLKITIHLLLVWSFSNGSHLMTLNKTHGRQQKCTKMLPIISFVTRWWRGWWNLIHLAETQRLDRRLPLAFELFFWGSQIFLLSELWTFRTFSQLLDLLSCKKKCTHVQSNTFWKIERFFGGPCNSSTFLGGHVFLKNFEFCYFLWLHA